MSQQLENYLKTISITNNTLNELVDVQKVLSNVDKIEIDLNSLNYLITQDEKEFNSRIEKLYLINPNCFSSLPILVGIRDPKNFEILIDNATTFITNLLDSVQNIKYFFYETHLWDLIKNNKIKNFVDFVTGVELGLDTNARKNRVGKRRETYIKNLLNNEYGSKPFIEIQEQVKVQLLDKTKKFDFIIKNKTNNKVVYIESSYYTSESGSKISETARSYLGLYNEINKANSSFIWLADGKGMLSIRKLLSEFNDSSYIVNTSQLIRKINQELGI